MSNSSQNNDQVTSKSQSGGINQFMKDMGISTKKNQNTKAKLQPETLEAREMMSVNPLDGGWFTVNEFTKMDISDSRNSAVNEILETTDFGDEGGVLDVPNEWLIQLNGDLLNKINNVDEATRYFQSMGITVVEGLGTEGALHVVINSGTAADQRLKLSAIVGIESFEPNQMLVAASTTTEGLENVEDVVNDAGASKLWNLNITETAGAWAQMPAGSESQEVIVAVLDSGVDITHPDLKDNIWVNTAEIAGDGKDNDGNGFKDDYYGWNFYAGNNNVMDDQGHGTHVAGTIAASANNAIGVAGVAPNAKILPLKFLNSSNNGFISDAARAINYTVALKNAGNNIVAINCSFGSTASYTIMTTAIENAGKAGIVVVTSAGNNGKSLDSFDYYPSKYNAANQINVAATTSTDALASYSNYSANYVDVAAPGSSVYSTTLGGGYGLKSGTSMSAPFVSGMVALIAAANPNLTPVQIKAAIVASVDQIDSVADKVISGGRVNVANAISLVTNNPSGEFLTMPKNVTVNTVSDSTIDVSWGTVEGATGYTVERSISGTDEWGVVYQGNKTTFTDHGLASNTTYVYRVVATKTEAGKQVQSGYSANISAKTDISCVTDITLDSTSSTAIKFTWTKPNGANYTYFEYATSPDGPWTLASCSTSTAKSFSGLTPDTEYYFRTYSATTSAATTVSATSEIFSVRTAPAQVTGIANPSKTNNSVDLTWDTVEGATNYIVEISTTNSSSAEWTVAYTGNDASCSISGLDSLTTYYFRIYSSNGNASEKFELENKSTVSSVKGYKTNADIPLAPEITSVTASSSSAITVAWEKSENATSYKLEYATSEDGPWTTAYTGTGVSRSVSGLSPDTNYFFRVSATNVTGTSEPSETISEKTLEKVPSKPTGQKATSVDSSSINVTWTATANAKEYLVEYATSTSGPWTTAYAGSETGFTMEGLNASTTYYFRVYASNGAGSSAASSTASAKTQVASTQTETPKETETPVTTPETPIEETPSTPVDSSIPSNVQVTGNASTISITWEAVEGAASYVAQYSEDGVTWTSIKTDTLTAKKSGIISLHWRVQAVFADGTTSEYSQTTVGYLLGYQPTDSTKETPTNVNAAGTSATRVTATWDAVEGATSYIVQRTTDGQTWTTVSTSGLSAGTTASSAVYWRVQAVFADGNVSKYSDVVAGYPTGMEPTGTVTIPEAPVIPEMSTTPGTPVEETPTTTPETPIEETPSTPVDSSIPSNVQVTGNASTISITWEAVEGAASYVAQYSADGITWSSIKTDTLTAKKSGISTLHWRVQAVFADGTTSEYSQTTVGYQLGYQPTDSSKETPTNVNAAGTSATRVTATWDAVEGATSYIVQRTTDGQTWTTVSTSGLSAGTTASSAVYWRVQAVFADGNVSKYSDVVAGYPVGMEPTGTVTIPEAPVIPEMSTTPGTSVEETPIATPETPVTTPEIPTEEAKHSATDDLSIPSNVQVTGAANTISITWEAVEGAASYVAQYSADGITWSSIKTDNLTAKKSGISTLHWRVQAVFADGTTSEYSQTTTGYLWGAQPADSTKGTPTNVNATGTANRVTASWNAVEGATSYIVQRTTDGQTWTSVSTSSLSAGTTSSTAVYWKVQAVFADGTVSEFSDVVVGYPL